jgi:hypothetical protein
MNESGVTIFKQNQKQQEKVSQEFGTFGSPEKPASIKK